MYGNTVRMNDSKHRQCFGGHSERETPGHIPNPEAKTLSADGTAGVTLWESRTPPDSFRQRAAPRGGPLLVKGLFTNEGVVVAGSRRPRAGFWRCSG